jgi:hypothetical protein
MIEPISINDDLPEISELVMFIRENSEEVYLGTYIGNKSFYISGGLLIDKPDVIVNDVTHWKPYFNESP